MGAFDDLNVAGQNFAEAMMGDTFSYSDGTNSLTGLTGVFGQTTGDYTFADFSVRRITTYTLITSKAQWGTVVPAYRATAVKDDGVNYLIDQVMGAQNNGEPAYEISLSVLT